MITERDFVLNYVLETHGKELPVSIEFAKQAYKMICENTSDNSETDKFICDNIYNSSVEIELKNIVGITEDSDYLYVKDKSLQGNHVLNGDNSIKFKQWYERKRG